LPIDDARLRWKSGQVIGLSRFNLSARGIISAARFVSMIERGGAVQRRLIESGSTLTQRLKQSKIVSVEDTPKSGEGYSGSHPQVLVLFFSMHF
jgi:hypothetical protein